MKFSKERARAAAESKYIKETNVMCELLKNKDVDGIKTYLVKFDQQKKQYAILKHHWTRSGMVETLINDMRNLVA